METPRGSGRDARASVCDELGMCCLKKVQCTCRCNGVHSTGITKKSIFTSASRGCTYVTHRMVKPSTFFSRLLVFLLNIISCYFFYFSFLMCKKLTFSRGKLRAPLKYQNLACAEKKFFVSTSFFLWTELREKFKHPNVFRSGLFVSSFYLF